MESGSISVSSVSFLLLIAAVAVFLVIRVLRRLRTTGAESRSEIDIAELGGFSYRQLVLISVAGLFLEMLMIRWVSCEIRIFAYFTNFVLVACFLGFGLGCYLCRRRVQLMALTMSLLLLTVILKAPLSPLRSTLICAISDASHTVVGAAQLLETFPNLFVVRLFFPQGNFLL